MKPSVLRILNVITLIATIFVNGWVSMPGNLPRTVGEVSDAYNTLITPAGYAFSIWGIIYLMLFAFVIYQFSRKRPQELVAKIGGWFILSNAANSIWIYCFLTDKFALSVICMFLLLFSLIMLVIRLNLARYDGGLRTILFVWWPIAIYLGWIVAASVVNVAATLVANDWTPVPFSEETWSVVMIIIATLVYLFLIIARNLRESAGVGIWALLAISVANGAQGEPAIISQVCYVAVGVLGVAILVHGIRGWKTNPINKLIRGEWSD